ncbi:MAG: hypothetical protein H5U40_06255 [Polyangiaceae bacterium]|nr:hypothetical protein [Polyangiaceae bacterium]
MVPHDMGETRGHKLACSAAALTPPAIRGAILGRVRFLFSWFALLCVSCGGGSRGGDAAEAMSSGLDRIEGLPSPALSLASTTERFQELWTAAQLALEEPLPSPDTADEEVYGDWVDQRLSRWLRHRAEALTRVKERLRGLGAAPAEERVMGAAVLGFLMEDTARAVLEAQVPHDPSRPARAAELRDALAGHVTPLYAAALEAYTVCVDHARGAAPHLHVWRAHCDERARALERE